MANKIKESRKTRTIVYLECPHGFSLFDPCDCTRVFAKFKNALRYAAKNQPVLSCILRTTRKGADDYNVYGINGGELVKYC